MFLYSNKWTSDHEENWSKYLFNFRKNKEINLLEIGLFEGQSTNWFLNNILTHKDSKLVGVDMKLSTNLLHNYELFESKDKATIIESKSLDYLIQCRQKFDIIYIDGSHKGKNVLEDIVLSWRLLQMNGFLILDDYRMFEGIYPNINRPKLAIDTFLSLYRDELEVSHKEYQVIVQKKFREIDENSIRLNDEVYIYFDMYNNHEQTALYKWVNKKEYKIIDTSSNELMIILEILNKNDHTTNFLQEEMKTIEKYKLQAILGL